MSEETVNKINEAVEKVTNEVAQEMVDKGEATIPKEAVVSDNDAILDAIKELTKQVTDLAKKQQVMNEAQAKWIKAGKF